MKRFKCVRNCSCLILERIINWQSPHFTIFKDALFPHLTSTDRRNVASSSEEQLTSVEILSTLITTLNNITLEL